MDERLKEELKFKDKTVLVFIGSELRADDGLGPYIGNSLNLKKDGLKIINAFSVIENYVEEIISWAPQKMIIVDAAFFGGAAGEMRLLPYEKLSSFKIVSTHSFPLEAILNIIKQDLPNLEIKILGVQPQDIGYCQRLSLVVKKAADEILEFFNREFL